MPYQDDDDYYSGLNDPYNSFRGMLNQDRRRDPFSYPYENEINQQFKEAETISTPEDYAVQQPQPLPKTPTSYMDEYVKLLSKPAGVSEQRYRDYINRGLPREEDYKPGKLTRFGAALGGVGMALQGNTAGGSKLVEDRLHAPYEEALRRYTLEGAQLGKAHEFEQQDYNRQIQVARALAEQQRAERDDLRLEAEARSRAEARLAANWRFEKTQDGKGLWMKVNSKSPTGYDVIPVLEKLDLTAAEKMQNETDAAVQKQLAMQPGEQTMARYRENLQRGTQRIRLHHEDTMQDKRFMNAETMRLAGVAERDAREKRNREHALEFQQRGFSNAQYMLGLRQQFETNQKIEERARDAFMRDPQRLQSNYIKYTGKISEDPSLEKDGLVTKDQATGGYSPPVNPGMTDIRKYQRFVDLFNEYYAGILPPLGRDPIYIESKPSPFVTPPKPTGGPIRPEDIGSIK